MTLSSSSSFSLLQCWWSNHHHLIHFLHCFVIRTCHVFGTFIFSSLLHKTNERCLLGWLALQNAFLIFAPKAYANYSHFIHITGFNRIQKFLINLILTQNYRSLKISKDCRKQRIQNHRKTKQKNHLDNRLSNGPNWIT